MRIQQFLQLLYLLSVGGDHTDRLHVDEGRPAHAQIFNVALDLQMIRIIKSHGVSVVSETPLAFDKW